MSRLIDADALKEAMRKKFKTVPDRCEVNEVINAAPTIDAIPVEWLRNLCAIAKMEADDKMFIDWLIQTWREEQEAR